MTKVQRDGPASYGLVPGDRILEVGRVSGMPIKTYNIDWRLLALYNQV